MSLWPHTHWRQSRKEVRHSGDKNYPLLTKSTELIMFDFGDNVDRDTVGKVERPGDSRLSTNRQQSRKYRRQSRQSTLLPINKKVKLTNVKSRLSSQNKKYITLI